MPNFNEEDSVHSSLNHVYVLNAQLNIKQKFMCITSTVMSGTCKVILNFADSDRCFQHIHS